MNRALLWIAHIAHRPALDHLLHRLAPVAGRQWFPPLGGVMAFAATLSMTVPTVPLLGALVVLNPRRWLAISIWTMLGSALGGALLVHLFGHFGALFLAAKLPELMASPHWQHMAAMTSHHGWWMLALIAASPVSQTPFLLVAAILGMPAFAVFFSLVAGKAVKYGLVAVVTSRTAEDLASAYGSRTPPDG